MRYVSFLILVLIVFLSVDTFGQKAMTRSLSQTTQTTSTTKATVGAFGEPLEVKETIEVVEETSKKLVRHFDLAEENTINVVEEEVTTVSESSKSISAVNATEVMVINERNPWNVGPPKSEVFLFHHAEIVTNESGFYVQLMESEEILNKEHNIYQEFGNLRIKATINSQFCYLIGSFKTKEACTNFLNNIILPRYPEAKLVEFSEGESK